MNTEKHLEIVKKYELVADQERKKEDLHFNGSDAAIESLKQGATSMRALFEYLKNERGYDGMQMWEIFKANGRSTSSGFQNLILFLERAFDQSEAKMMPVYINAAQFDIALNEAVSHIKEIIAYLNIHGGIDEQEGHQIIHRAEKFAQEHAQTSPIQEIQCDNTCDLRRFYDHNGNRCCKLWREVEPKKRQEMFTDAELDQVFGSANFGTTSKRDVVKYALLKASCGYANGHTAHCIITELGLIDQHTRSLTEKGREFLWQQFGHKSF